MNATVPTGDSLLKRQRGTRFVDALEGTALFAAVFLVYSFNYDTEGVGKTLTNAALVLFMATELLVLIGTRKMVVHPCWTMFMAFLFVCSLSIFWSAAPDRTFARVQSLVVMACFYFFLQSYLLAEGKTRERTQFLCQVIVVSAAFAAVYLLLQSDWREGVRVNQIVGDSNQSSAYFAYSMPVAMFCASKRIIPRVLVVLQIGLAASAILVSGSRSGLIAALIAIATYWMILQKDKRSAFLKAALGLVFIAAGAGLLLHFILTNPIAHEIIGRRLESIVQILGGEQSAINERSYYERNDLRQLGFALWFQSPIFGHGINTFGYFAQSSIRDTFSHNNYVELLEGVGVVGCLLYYSQHVMIINAARRINGERLALVTAMLASMLLMHWFVVFYYQKLEFVFLALLGAVAFSFPRSARRQRGRSRG